MSADILSSPRASLSLRARLQSLYSRLQYQPCCIRLSTLHPRHAALLAALPLLILLLCLAVALSVPGTDCWSPDRPYLGPASVTETGLHCVAWDRINRTVHSVTVDRYPNSGLGAHSACRNPDSSLQPWCYTSLTKNLYDYCSVPRCEESCAESSCVDTDMTAATDRDQSCDSSVTLLHADRPEAGGIYVMTAQWANGRGIYAQAVPVTRVPICLSWHGLYRHWWLGPCIHRGKNTGLAWLEEDGRCPYYGKVWRKAGSDILLPGMIVTRSGCMEYSVVYQGVILDDRVKHNGGLYTPGTPVAAECQELCQDTVGCAGFTWYRGANCTLYSSLEKHKERVEGAVSGRPSCQEKVKVGCPADSEILDSGVCVRFLSSCAEGCSRWKAMEECEITGGFLADSLGLKDLLDLLQLVSRTYYKSTWWIGASDFRKVTGQFFSEFGEKPLPTTGELWVNATKISTVGQQGRSEKHLCVFINHYEGEEGGMRLDSVSCQAEVARPLCQYRTM